ncbi:LCP family protein [Pediococcus argentinicus]|uniref:LCP family glycopolymer transferase n=1 Tax=Pediococcus argentinicus TaxID=480391 RepID=UPI00338FF6EA
MRREDVVKKHHPIRNTILVVLGVLIISGVVYGARKYMALKNAVGDAYQSANIKKDRDVNNQMSKKQPISILLMGTDTGALGRSYKGRTDSMMIVTINPQKNKTTITSIPRDTGVTIPGYEKQSPSKINAAYAFGKAGTSMKTVQGLLNVPLDFYAMINMGGMEKVVDEIGGVDLTPTLSFSYGGYKYTKGQPTHMDGKKALQYSRMRYDDPQNDYGRQTRQREVLMAILHKSGSVSTLLNKNFIQSITNETQTDFTFDNLVDLAKDYRGATKNVSETHLQGHGQTVNGQSMEIMPKAELQRVTDFVRSGLGLGHSETGNAAIGDSAANTDNSAVESANVNAGN